MASLGLDGKDVLSVQAPGIHNIDKCVVFGPCVGVHSGYKGSWGPHQCLQVQRLGTMAGSGSSCAWWCTHTQLWGTAAGACIMAGVRDTHIMVRAAAGSKDRGQL